MILDEKYLIFQIFNYSNFHIKFLLINFSFLTILFFKHPALDFKV